MALVLLSEEGETIIEVPVSSRDVRGDDVSPEIRDFMEITGLSNYISIDIADIE